MNQTQCDRGVSRVKQRALPFNHIPMTGCGVRCERFSGTREKIRYHRVHWDAPTRDQDTGLARGSESRGNPPLGQRFVERERGILFSHTAISAHHQ